MSRAFNSPKSEEMSLPRGVVWGVSTSSYQLEGTTRADGPSIWDIYATQAGQIANGDTGDVACDHDHRNAEDVALIRELAVTPCRFSVAWPRVVPEGRCAVNEAGLTFYDRLITASEQTSTWDRAPVSEVSAR